MRFPELYTPTLNILPNQNIGYIIFPFWDTKYASATVPQGGVFGLNSKVSQFGKTYLDWQAWQPPNWICRRNQIPETTGPEATKSTSLRSVSSNHAGMSDDVTASTKSLTAFSLDSFWGGMPKFWYKMEDITAVQVKASNLFQSK